LPVRAYLHYLLRFYAGFLPCYFGASLIDTALFQPHVLAAAWERQIPLVEWMIVPYLSIGFTYLLPLFYLRAAAIGQLSRQLTVAIVLAAVLFILIPTRPDFLPQAFSGVFRPLHALLVGMDVSHNLVPSLHVALATLNIWCCRPRAGRLAFLLLLAWLALIAASTVLIHRHHLLDVVTGFALAFGVMRWLPLTPEPADAGARTSQP
jgi:membrane-associated phospholipid phosphatase